MMTGILQEHFRCPDEVGLLRRPECDAGPAGFFRLGSAVTVFGRLAAGAAADRPEDARADALAGVEMGGGECRLPFDPAEVIANLRFERYPGAGHPGGTGPLWWRTAARAYYAFRPLMPVSVRKYVQRSVVGRSARAAPRFPAWPIDTTVERTLETLLALAMQARGLNRIPFIWFWPDGRGSAVAMTHDVETAAGRDFTPTLMDLDERYGLKASFQVIPEKRYAVPEAWLGLIRERGFEINVHDLNHDGRLFIHREEFLRRAERINGYGRQWGAQGFRSAVLYRNLDWFGALRFDYDMSLPNGAHFHPQAGGCCAVRPYFLGDMVEIPGTAAQDYILFHILGDYSTQVWEQQLDAAAAAHGVMCFSIHPDYILERRARGVVERLGEVLAERRVRGNLWFALPRDISRWWRQRHAMRLRREGSAWRIEGEGAERARLAWAEMQDGQLRYVLPAGPAAPPQAAEDAATHLLSMQSRLAPE